MSQRQQDFQQQKQHAAEELLKMSKIAANATHANAATKNQSSALGGIIPFLNIDSLDSDAILILGILLILLGEKKDNLLILTLFYILI